MQRRNGDHTSGDGGSPPCFQHELGPGGSPLDPQQTRDVARWRKVERERLLALRASLPAEVRAAHAAAVARDLDRLIPLRDGTLVSVYWPIRGEPDLRAWMHAARTRGLRIALPVAVALETPLTFREWRPGARLAHGIWKIPYPADGAEVTPTTVLAPLVGFDDACFRLGYGGGFFDRTLAALTPRPTTIGIGYAPTRIRTIFPQPHDVPMDWVVTGDAPALQRAAVISPEAAGP